VTAPTTAHARELWHEMAQAAMPVAA
jgi:hypothetical protein